MFAASKTAASGSAPDAQFNYVTLLLHGDGTNGAQNNTFVDGSTNNFTITRNGNTTQGSFSPYGSGWSNYFGGSSDWLTLPSNAAWTLGSTFTIEAWVNPAVFSANSKRICQADSGIDLSVNSSGYINFNAATTTTALSLNVWSHVAFVCNSGTSTLYINGVASGFTGTNTGVNVAGTSTLTVGTYQTNSGYAWQGYISNFRIVKSSAVYTSNFTPSTTPLTAITNTQLLTCQSNRFIDNSSNAFVITTSGTPSVQRFNPFGTSTAYSTSVIGGSAYFDGSGDCLKFPTNSGLLGSNDFSFEAWVYPVTLSSIAVISMGQSDLGSAAGSAYGFYVSPSGDASDLFVGSTTYSVTSPNPKIGAWNHVAWVRTGTTFSSYLNGVRVSTTSVSGSVNNGDTTYPASIGGFSNGPVGRPFNGYISGYQRIIGSGGYNATSSTITIPTTPPTAVTNTNALLNFTNGAIFDNAMMSDLETAGNAQISTSVKKYGTGSMYFDGTGDALSAPSSTNFGFGSGNYTVELWVYGNFSGAYNTVFDNRISSAVGIAIYAGISSTLTVADNSAIIIAGGTISTNTWTHIAVVRNGTTVTAYINGTSVGSATDSRTYASSAAIFVGQNSSGSQSFTGYMDDFRITKGYARYTANFTPPTAAFPNIGPV